MNQPSGNIEFSYANWRAGFMRTTLIGACAFGALAVILTVFVGSSGPFYNGLYIGAYVALLAVTILPASYSIRAGVIIALIFGLGISGLLETGIWGDSRLFMLGAIALASLLFSWRVGWAITGLTMLSYLISGWLVLSGVIAISSSGVTPGNLGNWTSGSVTVLLLAVLIVNGVRLTQDEFDKAQNRAQAALNLIRDESYILEQRVEQRTQDVTNANRVNEYRAHMFQAIAQVTRAIISTQNLQDLLSQITQVISQQFDYYHAGIFLIDANKLYAVLSAANSEGGQRMLARNHKLRMGQVGIVGYVAGNAKPRIALDTGADAVYFNNPDLPETHSEMALPLMQAGGQIIGVLDIQSVEPNAFNLEDIEILTTLADQISVAIANARLYEETQKTLIEAEMLYRRDLQAGWKKFTRYKKIAGVRRMGSKASIYTEPMKLPGALEALRSETTHRYSAQNSQTTIPVKLRGEVVGILSVKTDEERKWTDDEMDVVAAIVERAALSIENARLLAESRKVADKERVIRQISAKVISYTDRDNILQAAVAEIGRALSGSEVTLQLQKVNASDADSK